MNNYDLSRIHENGIRKNLDKLDSLMSTIKISEESQIKNILSQIEKLITDTETKIRNYQISTEYSDSSKIKEFQKKIQSYKNKFKTLSKKNLSNSEDYNYYHRDDSTQSLTSNSFNKIQLATRNTIEMESMTGNILGNLNNQSNQMKGVTNKLGLMNTDIDSSSGILTKMIGRGNRDKKIIVLVALFFCVCIIALIIYKLINLII